MHVHFVSSQIWRVSSGYLYISQNYAISDVNTERLQRVQKCLFNSTKHENSVQFVKRNGQTTEVCWVQQQTNTYTDIMFRCYVTRLIFLSVDESTSPPLLRPPPLVGERGIAISVSVCLSVCLFVCLCIHSHHSWWNEWIRIKDDANASFSLPGGGTGGKVCRLRLQLEIGVQASIHFSRHQQKSRVFCVKFWHKRPKTGVYRW